MRKERHQRRLVDVTPGRLEHREVELVALPAIATGDEGEQHPGGEGGEDHGSVRPVPDPPRHALPAHVRHAAQPRTDGVSVAGTIVPVMFLLEPDSPAVISPTDLRVAGACEFALLRRFDVVSGRARRSMSRTTRSWRGPRRSATRTSSATCAR